MESNRLVKSHFGVNWQLIFFHNSSGKVFFTKNSPDLLFCNQSQKFSILGTLTNNYKINGFFEFLLEYPERNYFVHWRQKKNPIKAESDVGFVPLHVPCNPSVFNGLGLSSASLPTFLDGNIGSDKWHYAIGSYSRYVSEDCFPGPCFYDENNHEIGISLVSLYVRIRTMISCKITKASSYGKCLLIVLLVS